MLGLVLLVVLLHGLGLAPRNLDSTSQQLMVLGRGEFLAVLFAALLGALSFTSETRHGTIRPTFLISPKRGRVVAAKLWTSAFIGGGFGFTASALATSVGTAALRARGIDIRLDAGDYTLLLGGAAVAAALWAAIGVALGAIIRNQVPTLIGMCAWILFVEGLLVGDVAGIADVGRFAPGAAAAAITGQDPGTLVAPAIGVLLLALYVTAATMAGLMATRARDVS